MKPMTKPHMRIKDAASFVGAKVFHIVRSIKPFAKRARAVETQKLVRRMKGRAEKGEDTARQARELAVLKGLDLEALSRELYGRFYRQAADAATKELWPAPPSSKEGAAAAEYADVFARLLASSPVKEARAETAAALAKYAAQLRDWQQAQRGEENHEPMPDTAAEEEPLPPAPAAPAKEARPAKRLKSRDEKITEAMMKKLKRKNGNRMGQRARRELWERQFGEKAKHVQSLVEQNKEMKEVKEKKEKKAAAKPEELHPSWKAKVAQREAQERAMAEMAAVKPTKIKF